MQNILEQIGKHGLVPVIAIDHAENALPLGNALIEGGLPCAEITFRTDAAEGAIRSMVKAFPQALVGAGTVLSLEQAQRAVNAGASFIVSPGFSPPVVTWCVKNNIPVTPGVVTPSEIMMALDQGLQVLKFFPADVYGGATALKAIGAAFREVRFIPTGGVTASNLADYLSMKNVHACGGSWMVKQQLIADGEFGRITSLVKEAVAIVRQVRG